MRHPTVFMQKQFWRVMLLAMPKQGTMNISEEKQGPTLIRHQVLHIF